MSTPTPNVPTVSASPGENRSSDERLELLVPLDGSAFARAVAPQVRKLFPAERTRLELLHVAQPPIRTEQALHTPAMLGPGAAFYHPVLVGSELQRHPLEDDARLDDYRTELRAELRHEVDDFAQHGYDASATVVFGDPVTEIARAAVEGKVDLVAMATHARSGVGRLLLGSVGKGVLERVTVPVLLFPATEIDAAGGDADDDADGATDGDAS